MADSSETKGRAKDVERKNEYDFSKGERGKFYNPDGELNLPIYLDREIAEFVQKLSVKKKIDRNKLVNKLLRKDMEIMEL